MGVPSTGARGSTGAGARHVPGERRDWSSHLVGDPDGSGSGVHSYQSADSGGGSPPQISMVASRAAVGASGFQVLDKQSILYHLHQVKKGRLTLDQLALALGSDSPTASGEPGILHHNGLSNSGVPPSGLPGSSASHPGMPGTGAGHIWGEVAGVTSVGVLGVGATQAGMPHAVTRHTSGPFADAEHTGSQGAGGLHVDLQVSGADLAGLQGIGGGCSGMSVSGPAHTGPRGLLPTASKVPIQGAKVHMTSGEHHQGLGAQVLGPNQAVLQVTGQPGADLSGVSRVGPGAQVSRLPIVAPIPVSGPAQAGIGAQVAVLPGSTVQRSGNQASSYVQTGQGAPFAGLHEVQPFGSGASDGLVASSQVDNMHPPDGFPSLGHCPSGLSGAVPGIGLAAPAPKSCAKPEAHTSPDSGDGNRGAWLHSATTPRGRGEFEPGDRVFWELPKLAPVTEPNAAVRASDWLYRSALMLRDLSSKSCLWWDKVYEAVLKYYHEYQRSDPLNRGLLRPDSPEDLQHHSLARLESRAVSMILHAVPESVSSQALATRSLSSVGLLFQILKQYQPGGLGERQELLKSLTDLTQASHAAEGVLTLQSWFRHVARARAMRVQLPDGSLLLAALDAMAKGILAENAQVAFRVSLNRHQLRLDYQAEIEVVEAYARNLMAEFEVLSLTSESVPSPKKPRLRKVKEQALAPSPKEGSTPSPPTANPGNVPPPLKPPPAKAPASSKACTSWLTDVGCKCGSKCRFVHDTETEALKGRCFTCSAKDHWANNCPVKQAERQGPAGPRIARARARARPLLERKLLM